MYTNSYSVCLPIKPVPFLCKTVIPFVAMLHAVNMLQTLTMAPH